MVTVFSPLSSTWFVLKASQPESKCILRSTPPQQMPLSHFTCKCSHDTGGSIFFESNKGCYCLYGQTFYRVIFWWRTVSVEPDNNTTDEREGNKDFIAEVSAGDDA